MQYVQQQNYGVPFHKNSSPAAIVLVVLVLFALLHNSVVVAPPPPLPLPIDVVVLRRWLRDNSVDARVDAEKEAGRGCGRSCCGCAATATKVPFSEPRKGRGGTWEGQELERADWLLGNWVGHPATPGLCSKRLKMAENWSETTENGIEIP